VNDVTKDSESSLLVQWLDGRDAECPVCSYNLRGLTVPVCPECAAPLRLAVASDNQHPGAWALAVISFALALGFDAVVAILITIAWIADPPAPAAVPMVRLLLASFLAPAVVCGAGVVALFARRRRWIRQPRKVQWRLAWAIFAIVGVCHALYGLYVASRL
jgi:hypothetical protein